MGPAVAVLAGVFAPSSFLLEAESLRDPRRPQPTLKVRLCSEN